MIVFDLCCATGGHVFEAWFASSAAFDDQRAKGLLMCPICASADIAKAPMAPRVGAKGNRASLANPVAMTRPDADVATKIAELMGKIAEVQAAALPTSEWVGRKFEQTARAMDAGELPTGSIYGETTPAETRALIEDGIGVMPLLVPIVPPDKRN